MSCLESPVDTFDIPPQTSGQAGTLAGLDWQDVSNELERTYYFGGSKEITVHFPRLLNVKRKPEGDSHRLVANGKSYYIPVGWIGISWVPKAGTDPYSF